MNKINLQLLKKEMPYKWRVQSANQWGASCVAYIDARYVQDILDDVCGPENWQIKYEEHKGNLFASIGILINNIWVWKSDCGTESAVEKQKGEASDAFKRAGVMWGIGRFLYSKKIVKLTVKQNDQQKYVPFVDGRFIMLPSEITRLCELQTNNKNTQTPPSPTKTPITPTELDWINLQGIFDYKKDLIDADKFDAVKKQVEGKLEKNYEYTLNYLNNLKKL
jgi:hypothetical protein